MAGSSSFSSRPVKPASLLPLFSTGPQRSSDKLPPSPPHHPALHHKLHPLQFRNIAQRIPVHRDNVRVLPCLDRPQILLLIQQRRTVCPRVSPTPGFLPECKRSFGSE